MPTGSAGFRATAVRHPLLAAHADSPRPAWLWSADGSRILWCNAAAAAALGVSDPRLLETPRSLADPHRRQVAQLAERLASDGRMRMERLRGFGARLGQLMTCACSRFDTQDGESAVLLIATERPARTASSAPVRTDDAGERLRDEASEDAPVAELASAQAHYADAGDKPDLRPPAEAGLTAVADPADAARDELSGADAAASAASPRLLEAEGERGAAPAGTDHDAPAEAVEPVDRTTRPLRFVWQIDAANRFTLVTDEFLRIAGEPTTSMQGRPWNEVAQTLDLDPLGRIARAIAERESWSAIAVPWPLGGADKRAAVELSGMPMFDSARNFAGYRGFGLHRPATPASSGTGAPPADGNPVEIPAAKLHLHPAPVAATAAPTAPNNTHQAETEIVEPPQNVVPFPSSGDARPPSLSPVENHAFDEIARRLTERLDNGDRADQPGTASGADASDGHDGTGEDGNPDQAAWLTAAPAPARGNGARDRILMDLMPSGILIYRLDRLLYANRAFLDRTGFDSLNALQEAGGLDALYVEPGPAPSSAASSEGMPLTIAAPADDGASVQARLFSILWDSDDAHALILQDTPAASKVPVAADSERPVPAAAPAPPPAGNALEAVFETASDGIVLFDRSGAIMSCNRSAETLFGADAEEFRALNFTDLFAAESQAIVLEYFESLDSPAPPGPPDHGREVLGRTRAGVFVGLTMTMGRAGATGEQFFAVFRDLSQVKKSELELRSAQRKADHAVAAKADALARIIHEIRGPLSTIAGCADTMIDERFGTAGNERHAAHLKDIRAEAQKAIAILDDIVNISSIEAGRVDLNLVSQNLNEMVEQCVGVLQPQANRERVIIRTSLAHALPLVMADTRALRQITMNIVTSSIRSSRAGGQVIVSTAPGADGGAILRVRDTGRRPGDGEPAANASAQAIADRGAIDLSLARALAEANRAQFQVRTTDNASTLIEVAFATMRARTG